MTKKQYRRPTRLLVHFQLCEEVVEIFIMAEKPKPLILLVHGAAHVPAHFDAFVPELQRRGFRVENPLLPSAGSVEATFDDDVRRIREIALKHITAGTDVVALMHSHGGKVGTRALSGLGSKKLSSESLGTAAVRRLIYVTASIPPQTGVLPDSFKSNPNPPAVTVSDGAIRFDDPKFYFYNDLSPGQQETAIKLLVPWPVKVRVAGAQPLEVEAAWWHIPVLQIVCDIDNVLTKAYQENMGSALRQALEGKAEVDVRHLNSGHSPFINMPGELADMVEQICLQDSA